MVQIYDMYQLYMYKKSSCMQIKIKCIKNAIILTVQLVGDSPEMRKGCRMHAMTTQAWQPQ